MQIKYDAKADGLTIIFNDMKPNDSVGISKDAIAYLYGQTLVMIRLRNASKHADDVSTVTSKYISKDEPYPMEIEVTRSQED